MYEGFDTITLPLTIIQIELEYLGKVFCNICYSNEAVN